MTGSGRIESELDRARRLLYGDDSFFTPPNPALETKTRFLLRPGATKAAEAFERDYPAFLLALASAIRTGLDPIVAFCRTEELFDQSSLLRIELKKSREEIERGVPEDIALSRFASAIKHPDLDLFRAAFILSRRQGSSLSPCLQRLVKVTRQRQSFRRKMASAVAMQKLSAFGIAACAGAIGVIQFLSNPSAFRQTFADPLGSKTIFLGGFLMAAGTGWMLFLTRRRV